ncbi:MAG TPA: GAF domain-containing protein [Anaerolineaceae bacterium]|nr:GAF domain-containing protein [Anaerolineaceae bacterium]
MSGTSSPQPGQSGPASAVGEALVLKERILNTLLRGCSILGLVVYGLVLTNLYPRHLWGILTAYTIGYVWLVTITLLRKIPYTFRVYSFLVILYVIGLGGLFDSGLSGDGKAFLLVFSAMACLLLGLRAGMIALGFSVVTMAVVGWGMSTGAFPLPPVAAMANSGTPTEWGASIAIILTVGMIIIVSMATIMLGLTQSLDKSHELITKMEGQQAGLELAVNQRTEDLQHRLVQLRTAAEISQSIGGELNPQALLEKIIHLIQDRFGLYYVGAFLVDEDGKFAVLKAGTGEAGAKMLAARHRLEVGATSMIGWSILNRKARIALDVGLDATRFNNPNLPLTRSEMALPLIAHDKVLGSLTVQSSSPRAFDEDDILVMQGIADILATALENGRLFQETQKNLDEIEALHRQYLSEAWSEAESVMGGLHVSYESSETRPVDASVESIQIPLLLRDQVIGQVTLETNAGSLSAEDMAFIDSITTQTALALENARLLEETQRRARQEQTLNEMSMSFSKAFRVEDILKIAVQELGQLPSIAEVSVFLEPADNQAAVSSVSSGSPSNN